MSLRAVILDLGNVLAFHDNALLFRKLGERAGLTEAQVNARVLHHPLWDQANRGHVDREGIRRGVCELLGLDLPMPEFAALWSCHFTINAPMIAHAEALASRTRLVLLSNTNALHMDDLRPRLPVLSRFHALVLSCETGLVKPEPAIYRLALERAGVEPNEAAFFDDMAPYAEAASALGVHGRVFRDAGEFPRQLRELGLDAL